jgi:GTPase SAR1 family protein
MKITSGKQTRAQRVVIYGVESVGKSTFAAKFPKPLFLDVEGGTAHLDTNRSEIDDAAALESAIRECQTASYDTIIIDSIDWTERMLVDQLLAEHKKKSVEDFGYGKGYVMAAEKMARLLSQLDLLIDAGKNVVLIAHAQVRRAEPPDLMAAYDRYELKLEKKASPLVKEWADELWFFKFKTKTVESESGRSKGVGGKERIILTTHSAAYDAKTRSGLAEELPLVWESVAHLFADIVAPAAAAPAVAEQPAQQPMQDWKARLTEHEGAVNQFLISRNVLTSEQTWRDCEPDYLQRVAGRVDQFVNTALEWRATNA